MPRIFKIAGTPLPGFGDDTPFLSKTHQIFQSGIIHHAIAHIVGKHRKQLRQFVRIQFVERCRLRQFMRQVAPSVLLPQLQPRRDSREKQQNKQSEIATPQHRHDRQTLRHNQRQHRQQAIIITRMLQYRRLLYERLANQHYNRQPYEITTAQQRFQAILRT